MKKGQTEFNWKRTPKIPCSIGNARNTEKNPKSIDLELGIKISSDFTTGFGSEPVECSESKRSAAPRMEWESGGEESGRRLPFYFEAHTRLITAARRGTRGPVVRVKTPGDV